MPNYTYTARDKQGKIQKGDFTATDQSAAATTLIDRGLTPIAISEKKIKSGVSFKIGGKVKLQDKVVFSRQFATMVNAGITISKALSILEKQTTNKSFKLALSDVSKQVEGGGALADALASHPKIFNGIYVNMVRAGETGGILDSVLDRLATQQEKDAEIIGKVRSAMIYPAVISFVTVAAFVFLMIGIVPKLAGILKDTGQELPIYTQILLFISDSLVQYGLFIGIAIGGSIGVLIYLARTNKSFRERIDILLIRMPIFGPIVVKMTMARFSRTFGSLMSSGISVLEAIESTSKALGNSVYRKRLATVAKEVKAGKNISEPLSKMSEFPPIVSQMVAVGEETGELDTVLVKLAGFYETEVDTTVSGLTSIIEPILIVVLGSLIGFIVVSVFGPLAQLSSGV